MLDAALWFLAIKAYWSELNAPIATLLLVIVGLLYWKVRQERDFYIVHRIGFARTYVESRTSNGVLSLRAERGKIEHSTGDAYEEFGAARAAFDYLSTMFSGDTWQEWEISLYVVRAFTPTQAIRRGKARKYPDRVLARTPYKQILDNRKSWEEDRKLFLKTERADAMRLQS